MLQLPEKSKDFFQIPIEKSKRGIQIYLKKQDTIYRFLKIKQSSDGSIECIFYNLNSKQKGISQTIEIGASSPKNIAKVVSENNYTEIHEVDPYVTYHTTGRVNYHGSTFKEQYFTPLDRIERPQFFFMVSFCKMDSFQTVDPATCDSKASIIVDISEFDRKRCNILFAIVPQKIPNIPSGTMPNFLIVAYPLFGLAIELLDDATSFNLSSIYSDTDVVKLCPHIDEQREQVLSINEAYLNYQHKLFGTKEIIILPPNGEGIIKAIFPVEMRRAPWIRLEFENERLIIDKDSVKRSQTNITFKVRDLKSNQVVKDSKMLRIKSLHLDAEIYEDESAPPEGYI